MNRKIVNRWFSGYDAVFALIILLFAGNVSAQVTANYLGYSADINGDGQPDILVKVMPKIIILPLDDDFNIPIPLQSTIPSFILLSNGTGYYRISTDLSTAADPRWVQGAVSVGVSPSQNPANPSLTITYTGANQQAFINGMSYGYEAKPCSNNSCTSTVFSATINSGGVQPGPRVVESYDYNVLGRLIKVGQDGATKTQYEYDKAGNRKQVNE